MNLLPKTLAISMCFAMTASTATLLVAQAPTTATTITVDSPALILPGSLKFTSGVSSKPAAAGVPSGNVSFYYDGTNLIGKAPLQILPATQSFVELAPFGVGFNPAGMASGLFTNTTHPDIVVIDQGGNGPQFLVSPGSGMGLFAPVQSFAMPGLTPIDTLDSIVEGSFTKAGSVEFLAHTSQSGSSYQVSNYVLLSHTGGVATSTVLATYNSGFIADAQAMSAGDFNEDGLDDIAYVVAGSHFGLALSSTTGSGTFANPPVLYLANGLCPTAVTTGKSTSSGHFDLLMTATQCNATGSTPGHLLVLRGDGAGNFATSVESLVTPDYDITSGTDPVSIAAADFNKDGKLDVVIADRAGSSVHVVYGNGDGTFQSTIATLSTLGVPTRLSVGDFNGDGYPDIAIALSSGGSVTVLLNDQKGGFTTSSQPYSAPASNTTLAPVDIVSNDFNTDGIADFAVLTPLLDAATAVDPEVTLFLTSASSQALLTTAPQSIPAGIHTLTASFPGDANLAASTSAGIQETVTQTVPGVGWPQPASLVYGTPLSGVQLNATATVPGVFTYTPAAGAVIPIGTDTLSASFRPTDAFDYAIANASQSIVVTRPSLVSIAPSAGTLGDANTTLTIVGQAFVPGATAFWGSTALVTTYVDLTHLTAVVPSALLQTAGTFAITVVDANSIPVAGVQTFTVTAPAAVVSATGPTTVSVTQQSGITLSISPYPVAVTATLALSFLPAPPNTISDPTVLFSNGSITIAVDVPAQDANPIPAVAFQSGSTAGTITIKIALSAGGLDITPASLTPLTIVIPAAPPLIGSVILTKNGTSLSLAITGLSSTREISQAHFHFVAASGKSLSTPDVSVPLTSTFSTWYQGSGSIPFGTQFLYTQPFTLDSDASSVGSVTVTLTNTQGESTPSNAQ